MTSFSWTAGPVRVVPAVLGPALMVLKVQEKSKWRVQRKLRSATVRVKPYRSWGLPGCHCHWRAERPPQPAERWRMSRRKTPLRIMKSFSARRKSRTSACRRSTSSTRKMPHDLSSAKRSLGAAGADAAAAAAVAAGAAGEAAGAAAVAEAAEAVAGPGAAVAGVRPTPVGQ